MGGLCSLGRSSFSNRVHPSQASCGSGFSTSSTAEHYTQLNFPGPIPKEILSGVIFGDRPCTAPPFHGGYPHETASVASASALATSPLRPLSHGNLSSSLALDLTMSFLPPFTPPVVIPPAPTPVPSVLAASPAPASSLVPTPPGGYPHALASVVSMHASVALPLQPLPQEDFSSSLAFHFHGGSSPSAVGSFSGASCGRSGPCSISSFARGTFVFH
jgi:hypothetical protein